MSRQVTEQVRRIFDGADRRRRPQARYVGDDRRNPALFPLEDPAARAARDAQDPATEQDHYGEEDDRRV